MPLVRTCANENFDASTQTCSAEEWVSQPAGWLPLPDLPAQDGAVIGFAIIGALFPVWVWKQIGKTLDESSKSTDDN